MIEIALKEINKYYGANHILKGVNLEIINGEKVGLLGENGSGKSTILKIIAGIEKQDSGERMIRRGALFGYLDQIPEFNDNMTVNDVLHSVFEELNKLNKEMRILESQFSLSSDIELLLERYGKLQHRFEIMGGYEIENNIESICNGLKLDKKFREKLFKVLSGGEQTRVMLGRLLLQQPDILLLDEPTNHLDIDSIEWLEEFVHQYKGTCIIVSHDRYFMDKAVSKIVEVSNGILENYKGNYSYYVKEKESRLRIQKNRYEQQYKKILQLEEAAKKMHEWARQADNEDMHRRAFSIEKRIERMEKIEKPITARNMSSSFQELSFSGKEVILARGIRKSFKDKVILNGLNFSVFKGEKIALLGENGCGKSTIIRILTKEYELDAGELKTGESICYGYLPQIVTFEDLESTVLETVVRALKLTEGEARKLLAKYKFKGENVFKTVGKLSGGEKSRLKICLLMQNKVNLLLLDEPTNHLDIPSREWLEETLEEYEGTLVFISHDRYFINKFATKIFELKEGRIIEYIGDYESYRAKKIESSELPEKNNDNIQVKNKSNNKLKTIKDSENKRQRLEMKITEIEARLKEIEKEIEINCKEYLKLQQLLTDKKIAEDELEIAYTDWMSLETN